MDLCTRFEPLMAYALHCAQSKEGLSMEFSEIKARLLELINQERLIPLEGCSMTEENRALLEDARFAVVAFADEKLLNADRSDSSDWMSHSLQYHLFQTTEAGLIFFKRLQDLLCALRIPEEEDGLRLDLADRLERVARICDLTSPSLLLSVLQVYALCLLYGFCGRLLGENDQLARIRAAAALLLPSQAPVRVQQAPSPKPKVQTQFEVMACVLVPLCVCVAFWFFCAKILVEINIPGL